MREQRFFVVADFSTFRSDWVFYSARGMSEARRKAQRWVGRHQSGQAIVLSPESFRTYWKENFRTLYFMHPIVKDELYPSLELAA